MKSLDHGVIESCQQAAADGGREGGIARADGRHDPQHLRSFAEPHGHDLSAFKNRYVARVPVFGDDLRDHVVHAVDEP